MSDRLLERPASLKKYEFRYGLGGHYDYEIQFLKKEMLGAATFHTHFIMHTHHHRRQKPFEPYDEQD